MKLHGKRVLMLVADGVEENIVFEIKSRFEYEYAEVLLTSPYEFLTIETIAGNKRGSDLTIDFPLDAAQYNSFDALVIPDGMLAADLLVQDVATLQFVRSFYEKKVPIFASGEAIQVLTESGVIMDHVLVRNYQSVDVFMEQAIAILLDGQRPPRKLSGLSSDRKTHDMIST